MNCRQFVLKSIEALSAGLFIDRLPLRNKNIASFNLVTPKLELQCKYIIDTIILITVIIIVTKLLFGFQRDVCSTAE